MSLRSRKKGIMRSEKRSDRRIEGKEERQKHDVESIVDEVVVSAWPAHYLILSESPSLPRFDDCIEGVI